MIFDKIIDEENINLRDKKYISCMFYKEGNELATICRQLKMKTIDEKMKRCISTLRRYRTVEIKST